MIDDNIADSDADSITGSGSSLAMAAYRAATFAYQFVPKNTRETENEGEIHNHGNQEKENDAHHHITGVITYIGTGSSAGKNSLLNNTVDYCGTDSTFTKQQFQTYPDIQMYPTMAAAIVPIYNIPELLNTSSLILSRKTLAMIFASNITMWNDINIINDQCQNYTQTSSSCTADVAMRLPSQRIRRCVQSDGSGTSNAFTHALNLFVPGSFPDFGDSPQWNVSCGSLCPLSLAYQNSGVAGLVLSTPYCIGYVSSHELVSHFDPSLQTVTLINRAGNMIKASQESVEIAVLDQGVGFDTYNVATILDSSHPKAWPISVYTYLAVRTRSNKHSCHERTILVQFWIHWYTSTTVSNIITSLGYVRLPELITTGLISQLQDIQCITSNGVWIPAYTIPQAMPLPIAIPPWAKTFWEFYLFSYQHVESRTTIIPNIVTNPSPSLTSLILQALMTYDVRLLSTVNVTQQQQFQTTSPLVILSFAEIIGYQYDNNTPLYMTDRLLFNNTQPPSLQRLLYTPYASSFSFASIYQFPFLLEAIVPIYSLPVDLRSPHIITSFNLSMPLLHDMIIGDISSWLHPQIIQLNPILLQNAQAAGNVSLSRYPLSIAFSSRRSGITSLLRLIFSRLYPTFGKTIGLGTSPPEWCTTKSTSTSSSHCILYDTDQLVLAGVVNSPGTIGFAVYQEQLTTIANIANIESLYSSSISSSSSSSSSSSFLTVSATSISACLNHTSALQASSSSLNILTSLLSHMNIQDINVLNNIDINTIIMNAGLDLKILQQIQIPLIDIYTQYYAHDIPSHPSDFDVLSQCWPLTDVLFMQVRMDYASASQTTFQVPRDEAGHSSFTPSPSDLSLPSTSLSLLSLDCKRGLSLFSFLRWFFSLSQVSTSLMSLGFGAIPASITRLSYVALYRSTCQSLPLLMPITQDYTYGTPLRVGIVVLTILGVALCVAIFIFITIYRQQSLIRASSITFCYYVLLGCLLMYIMLPLLVIDVPTPTTCRGIPWLGGIGFSIAFGALFIKTWRIYMIFNSTQSKRLRITYLRNIQLTYILACIVCAEILFLIIWQVIVDPLTTNKWIDNKNHMRHITCTPTHSHFTTILAIFLALKAALLTFGCVVAWKVRSVQDLFNESRYIGVAIYSCVVCVVVFVPVTINYGIQNDRTLLALWFAIGIFIMATTTLLVLFVPKMVAVARDLEADSCSSGGLKTASPQSPNRALAKTSGGRTPGTVMTTATTTATATGTRSHSSGLSAGVGASAGQSPVLGSQSISDNKLNPALTLNAHMPSTSTSSTITTPTLAKRSNTNTTTYARTNSRIPSLGTIASTSTGTGGTAAELQLTVLPKPVTPDINGDSQIFHAPSVYAASGGATTGVGVVAGTCESQQAHHSNPTISLPPSSSPSLSSSSSSSSSSLFASGTGTGTGSPATTTTSLITKQTRSSKNFI